MSDMIYCDHPGPAGSTCVKPYGHSDAEGHQYAMSMEIPPDLGAVIDGIMQSLEAERDHYAKMNRRTRWLMWFMLLATALNVFAGLMKVMS